MRVFAGPNGSGKSTMYRQVSATKVNGRAVDLGIYINPDDIARELKTKGRYDANHLRVPITEGLFRQFAWRSGLIGAEFTKKDFNRGGHWLGRRFKLKQPDLADRFAQLLTQFFCDLLIRRRKKFSFETVFSHKSKLDLMRQARKAGYKVYLYFIATDDAEINVDRVRIRVAQGGHDVPTPTLKRRYDLSLGQLPEALKLAYHAFLFDNSKDVDPATQETGLFGEMKEVPAGKAWYWNTASIPDWFIRHYLLAAPTAMNVDLAKRALEARAEQGKG